MKKKIKIATLYRYFLYTVVMRDNLIQENSKNIFNSLEDDPSSVFLFFSTPIGVYLTHYYSSIYLIIEGWQDLKLSDAKIDKLISSPHTDKLRLLRNATYHYQKEPLSPKVLQFFGSEDDGTEKWITELYYAFSNYFIQNRSNIPNELREQFKEKSISEKATLMQKYILENENS